MSHAPTRTDLACRNCGTPAPLKFCPECGQETTLHPPTLGEFLHEFVGHYVALEGALWRTLRLLVTRPGRLTREYLAGRRRQYVLPLRLYLSCSFLFFLVVKLTPTPMLGQPVVVDVTGKRIGTLAEVRASEAAAASAARAASGAGSAAAPARHPYQVLRPVDCGAREQRGCNFVESFINNSAAGYSEHPQETVQHLRSHMVAYAPYLVFLLLPVFAGIMLLTYRDRRMGYGEHFVFSLHLHAFWFLLFLAMWLLPDSIGGLLQLAVPVYGTWAMREAYGGRWLPTLLRAVFASALYGVVLAIAMIAGTVALVAMG